MCELTGNYLLLLTQGNRHRSSLKIKRVYFKLYVHKWTHVPLHSSNLSLAEQVKSYLNQTAFKHVQPAFCRLRHPVHHARRPDLSPRLHPPIHYAGRYGRLECMKVLLDFGKLVLSLQVRSPGTMSKTSAEPITFTDSFQGLTSTNPRLRCTVSRLATAARSNMTIRTSRRPNSNPLVATPSKRVKVNDTGSIIGDLNVFYPR